MHRLNILSTFSLFIQTISSASTLIVPNTIQTGPSTAQFISDASGLDSPKVNPTNATSFDWWYFDAVSADSLSSVVIVFYLSTDLGFPFLLPGAAVSVDIFVSFDDGTLLFLPINDLPGTAGEATVVSDGEGASGSWANTGFSFEGSSDLSQYTVTIDSPLLGISGSLVLNSVCDHPASFKSPWLTSVDRTSTLPMQPRRSRRKSRSLPAYRLGERNSRLKRSSRFHDRWSRTKVRGAGIS
jgi:hypothetical protein